MSTHAKTSMRPARDARGFTLVELMVTVAIALFLLGGLLTIVQTVRRANMSQQALAQLQDEQRFALTVITDGFEQSELTEPRKALDEAGASTEVVSPRGRCD